MCGWFEGCKSVNFLLALYYVHRRCKLPQVMDQIPLFVRVVLLLMKCLTLRHKLSLDRLSRQLSHHAHQLHRHSLKPPQIFLNHQSELPVYINQHRWVFYIVTWRGCINLISQCLHIYVCIDSRCFLFSMYWLILFILSYKCSYFVSVHWQKRLSSFPFLTIINYPFLILWHLLVISSSCIYNYYVRAPHSYLLFIYLQQLVIFSLHIH